MTFEEALARNGKLVYKVKGVSMLPMLRQNQDLVVIVPPVGRLKKYDVALYRRGKAYVLHRVIRVKQNGYLIRGDNTYALEDVPDAAVLGVLTDFTRNGKPYSVDSAAYRRYVRFWHAVYPARRLAVKGWGWLKRVTKKMGIRRPGGRKQA